jgi:hypothetical protein
MTFSAATGKSASGVHLGQRASAGTFALYQAVASLHDVLAAFPSLTHLADVGYFIDGEDVGATTCLVAGGKLETLIGFGERSAVCSCTSQVVTIGCTWTMTVAATATERELLHAAQIVSADAQRLQALFGSLPDQACHPPPMQSLCCWCTARCPPWEHDRTSARYPWHCSR